MPSPYVIIDASFKMVAKLKSKEDSVRVETSVNSGQTWTQAGELTGPHNGEWSTEPHVILKSEHGRLTAVSGTYGYEVRITKRGTATLTAGSLQLVSRIELNPRSLPSVHPGRNSLTFSSAPAMERVEIAAPLEHVSVHGLEFVDEKGQGLLHPLAGSNGEATFVLEADGRPLAGFDVGARFIDISKGMAPDKLTAETRPTKVVTKNGEASIVWSASPEGPFQTLWTSPSNYTGADGGSVDRLLTWPETLQQVRSLPPGTKRIYLKLKTAGPAIDNIRLAAYAAAPAQTGKLTITQAWTEGSVRHEHSEVVTASETVHRFTLNVGPAASNESVTFSAQ